MSAVRRGWRARRNDENRMAAGARANIAAAAAEATAAHQSTAEYFQAKADQERWNNQRGTFTRESLAGATHVHTRMGWNIVVRLNAKSVTVREYDGTSTIPYGQIDDHQTVNTPRPVAA